MFGKFSSKFYVRISYFFFQILPQGFLGINGCNLCVGPAWGSEVIRCWLSPGVHFRYFLYQGRLKKSCLESHIYSTNLDYCICHEVAYLVMNTTDTVSFSSLLAVAIIAFLVYFTWVPTLNPLWKSEDAQVRGGTGERRISWTLVLILHYDISLIHLWMCPRKLFRRKQFGWEYSWEEGGVRG